MNNEELINIIVNRYFETIEIFLLNFNHSERILQLKEAESQLIKKKIMNPTDKMIDESLNQIKRLIKILEYADSSKNLII